MQPEEGSWGREDPAGIFLVSQHSLYGDKQEDKQCWAVRHCGRWQTAEG